MRDKTKNTRVQQMLSSGKIGGGQTLFVDCYNQSASTICGTIGTRIDGSNHYWIAIPEEINMRVYNRDTGTSGWDGEASVPAEPLRVRQATEKGYIEVQPGGLVDLSYPNSATRRGRVQDGGLVAPTLTRNTENSIFRYEGKMETNDKKGYGTLRGDDGKTYIYRIRKLTPRECFRLMGVTEENIDNIQSAGISRTQQYKMAGNSIVVDVLYHIFRNLFCEHEKTTLF